VSRLLWRSSQRYLARHPWQFGLAVLGVALGVAVVVAIDLASESAKRSFDLTREAVTGQTTHHIVGGPSGFDESLYRTLRVELGVRPCAPIVEAYVAMVNASSRSLQLLGVDIFAEAPFRDNLTDPVTTVTAALLPGFLRPGGAVLSFDVARELGLAPGASFEIQISGMRHTLTVAGLLQPTDSLRARALDNLLLTDIATAQELTGMMGRLSRIDLILPQDLNGTAQLARIRSALPPGVELLRAAARSEALEQMTRAFRLSLQALSLLALVVGTFLIYNTMTFSVVQRRGLLGTLRATGVRRREVCALVLFEALLIGVLGSSVGLLLGAVLGHALLTLVTRTINDLYFVLSVRELTLAPASLIKGFGLGSVATLMAALAPALEAMNAPPRSVLSRSLFEARVRRALPRATLTAACLLVLGGILTLLPGRSLMLAYAGLLSGLLGYTLLTPLAIVVVMGLLQSPLGALFGSLGRLSARGVIRSLSRTGIAIAALSVAVASTVGVGIMVESFRDTVRVWLQDSLQSDLYVSVPAPDGLRTLRPELIERLAAVPGVAAMSTSRWIEIESKQGHTHLGAIEMPQASFAGFRFKAGDPHRIWPAFQTGAVIVSEPYAYHNGLSAGSYLTLRTDFGEQAFAVAGVFYDYRTDQGVVMMDRRIYRRFWKDSGISGLGIRAVPGTDLDALANTLRRAAGELQDVMVRSNRALQQASLELFDRTFAITSVLRMLAVLVAFIGILSALMTLQLERSRELGILRAIGATPRQIFSLITGQTTLMGLAAGLAAIPIGILLAVVLIFVINQRSFGWTMQLVVDPVILSQGLLLAITAAVLAGLYPAARMARLSPAQALREE
jgi:ABC-type transport system, involved in lipoprotein release, permease component